MKEELLKLLKDTYPEHVSGEELSEKFGVSRTAVWKWINQLKEMGYTIESQTNKGYRLGGTPDSLNPYELQPLLRTNVVGSNIIYCESVDSTNSHAKREAEKGAADGSVVIAEEQLAGKGRLGRGWVSPNGKGRWMSIVLRPDINPSDAAKVTLAAACAVSRGITAACGLDAGIKWPNDIVLNGRKLCGILTEMNGELDKVNFLVVGIGINANLDKTDFDEELAQKATSLKIELGRVIDRKYLTACILNEFEQIYENFAKSGSIRDIIPEYRERLALLGKQVRVLSKNQHITGKAVDITDEGLLVIRLEDGSLKEIMSGEVSVRGLQGYI